MSRLADLLVRRVCGCADCVGLIVTGFWKRLPRSASAVWCASQRLEEKRLEEKMFLGGQP